MQMELRERARPMEPRVYPHLMPGPAYMHGIVLWLGPWLADRQCRLMLGGQLTLTPFGRLEISTQSDIWAHLIPFCRSLHSRPMYGAIDSKPCHILTATNHPSDLG